MSCYTGRVRCPVCTADDWTILAVTDFHALCFEAVTKLHTFCFGCGQVDDLDPLRALIAERRDRAWLHRAVNESQP